MTSQDGARQCYTKRCRTVHRFTNLQPSIPLIPGTQSSLTLGWHFVINGDYWYMQVTTTVHSKNIMLLTLFFKETIILGQDQDVWLTCGKSALPITNSTWYIIYALFKWVSFWTGRSDYTCRKRMHMGVMDRGFTVPIKISLFVHLYTCYKLTATE
jgi:hypothetical protein